MHRWKHLFAASLLAAVAVTTTTVAEPDLPALCAPDGALGAWPLLALPLHVADLQDLHPDLYASDIAVAPADDAGLADQCRALGAHATWFYHQLARNLGLTTACEGLEPCATVLACTADACGLHLQTDGCQGDTCPKLAGCEGDACLQAATTADACAGTIDDGGDGTGTKVGGDGVSTDDTSDDDDGSKDRLQEEGPRTTLSTASPPDSQECQEYCSPTSTTSRDEYRNGDCACDTFPRSPTDLDGDGALNEFDADDDCDHLSDELEEGIMWLQPASPNNPFIMVPSGAPAQITLYFDTLAWRTDKWEDLGEGDAGWNTPDGTQYPDPYLKMGTSFTSQTSLTDAIPSSFNKADHPWNVGAAGYEWDKGINGYSVSKAALPSMPSNYDSTQYKLRDSAAGTPRIAVAFELWEDDAGSSDRGEDDLILGLERLDYLTQYASTDVRPSAFGSTMYGIASVDLVDVDITVRTNISSCAIQWAGLVMGGSYVVQSSQVADYLECTG